MQSRFIYQLVNSIQYMTQLIEIFTRTILCLEHYFESLRTHFNCFVYLLKNCHFEFLLGRTEYIVVWNTHFDVVLINYTIQKHSKVTEISINCSESEIIVQTSRHENIGNPIRRTSNFARTSIAWAVNWQFSKDGGRWCGRCETGHNRKWKQIVNIMLWSVFKIFNNNEIACLF